MAKSKSKSEVEHLKGTIRRLQKEVKRGKKRKHLYQDLEEKEAERLLEEEFEERKIIKKNKCPKCSGELETIEGTKLKVLLCKDCDYRTSKKI